MNLTNKNGCALVRRNFDRLIMRVFTNHLVVYIIEVTKIILNLFIFFFLRKDFKRTKTLTNKKPTNKTKISQQKNNEGNNILRVQTSKGVKVACFAFGAFFTLKLFS